MFRVNDYVVYGSTGVCKIEAISREDFGGDQDREYYVLTALYANSLSIYIPTDSRDVSMRRIMTKDEIYKLIKTIPDIDSTWNDDDHLRKTTFNEILQSGDQTKMIQLIKTLDERKQELEKDGKSLGNADAETMKAAEKILHNEFALVLDIEPEQVIPFIREEIRL
ncbi:MAG: CarD family transcriptional regulator [Bacillota bacterium]|nr:CarD family transcriptional regulator [Bacillota bacterium]